MRLSRFIIVVLCTISLTGLVYAGAGEDSLSKLQDGNRRFTSCEPAQKDVCDNRRQELTKGQHPFATILSCSDSRVSPEIIFDEGLGDVFIVRDAGNIVDPTTLGSIEYGAEHLHTPLLVILGHESCGAVQATLDAEGKPEGNIGAIIKKIMPAVKTAKKAKKSHDETLNLAVQENVKNTYKDIMKSKIIRELVHEGKLKIVAAEYYLGTGKVELIDLEPASHGRTGHAVHHGQN